MTAAVRRAARRDPQGKVEPRQPVAARLARAYGESALAVLHSGLSAAARARENRRVKTGRAPIVIGPRSAVFAPLAKLGLLGISVPAKYGGAGMDYISLGLASEELEYVDTSLRVVMSVHMGLNSMALLQWGTEEQKQRFLVPQAKGEKYAMFGLTDSQLLEIRSGAAAAEADFFEAVGRYADRGADAGLKERLRTALAQLQAVSEAGQVMPPKATYFYPKLPSGLVINCLA